MSSSDPWPPEWLRGVLELCALRIIAEGETYGYALIERLEAGGLGTIKGGTLYPLLNRLEDDGFLSSSWRQGDSGPGRKYFSITADGRTDLAHREERWRQFSQSVSIILNHKQKAKGK